MSSDKSVLAVIPARYASTRFPGKPLAIINGKPMIQHVWERVCQVSKIKRVVIATDDARIEAACREFGAEVCMTRPDHTSGTDRIWEVVQYLARQGDCYDWILNVQGDEPFINPAHLAQAVDRALCHSPEQAPDIVTLVTPTRTPEEFANPNVVKAVLAESGQALYFSRAQTPCNRDHAEQGYQTAFRHIGLYLYCYKALVRFAQLPPSPLEQIEKLEQLRALEAGMRIEAVIVSEAPIGIDTPEDLTRLLGTLI